MEDQIKLDLTNNFITSDDLFVAVIPVDEDQIMIYTKVEGLFIDDDGLAESNGFEGIFTFPVFEGEPVELINYQAL